MSTIDYTAIGLKIITALVKAGNPVTLPRTTGGEVHPVTGFVIAGVDATVITKGVLRNYSDSMVDGARILSGDRELVLGNEQVVTPSDKPTIGGEQWAIVNLKTLKPNGVTTLAYIAQVRR